MSNFDNIPTNQAVIINEPPPDGEKMTHYSFDVISASLHPGLSLEIWAFNLGYTRGYIWTNSLGTKLLTLTGSIK
jgi:hypothetical protein